jgi:hypothetical protein
MATLITASIHTTATLVHIRRVEIRPSIISAETRYVMDAATRPVEATKAVKATEAAAIARNSLKRSKIAVA